MEALNTLVASNTAFRTFAELALAMADGYAPSLRQDRAGPKALGLALEAKGHQVFWLAGSFWGWS